MNPIDEEQLCETKLVEVRFLLLNCMKIMISVCVHSRCSLSLCYHNLIHYFDSSVGTVVLNRCGKATNKVKTVSLAACSFGQGSSSDNSVFKIYFCLEIFLEYCRIGRLEIQCGLVLSARTHGAMSYLSFDFWNLTASELT